jgi:DNA-directed RNA polymerase specialized sigma24 family protein
MRPPISRPLRAATDATARVRAHLTEGDVAAAAHATFAAFGAELFGFLIGVLDDVAAARAVYVEIGERVARDLGAFEWQCCLRTWLYVVSRRALRDRRTRVGGDGAAVNASYSAVSLSRRRVRAPHTILRIRRSLTEAERELLILRVDRRLTWDEIALTALGEGATSDALVAESRRAREHVGEIVRRLEVVAVEQRIVPPHRAP